ncbi:SatD family protein [Tamlana sp. 2_MG-2023]|uniref:SatD family protein n=1 Tax=unclassified Tamlana TaxID=2614803 RepID=UPI0026E17FB7|nr:MULTISPECIES: SatD family protein [unclassified Tamlana]MDO6759199.1 SatD family protein [Tamlana sp. 2_MG-2023]MDO6790662.1 SatD family protein [Tamlana sp. 1_MG-2023]
MTSIITGDIINSKESSPKNWLESLKSILNHFGNTPATWEIYRGDSFQLEVTPQDALQACILIKATIKQFKNIDVRLAIGIGEKSFVSEKITESNGEAFVNSGECFEDLKKTTLAIKSPFANFDIQINIMLELAQLTINHWSSTSASLIKTTLEHPEFTQSELAETLGKTQGNISQGLKRAGLDELSKLLNYYKTQIQTLC